MSSALPPTTDVGSARVRRYADRGVGAFTHFVTFMTAPIASGWSGCRVGFAPTGKRRLCTAHTHLRHRFPNEDPVLFKQNAEELAVLKPAVLATVTRPAAIVMTQATTNIPIVFIVVPDPIGSHIVDDLARP